jgi:hypothetical protein
MPIYIGLRIPSPGDARTPRCTSRSSPHIFLERRRRFMRRRKCAGALSTFGCDVHLASAADKEM